VKLYNRVTNKDKAILYVQSDSVFANVM